MKKWLVAAVVSTLLLGLGVIGQWAVAQSSPPAAADQPAAPVKQSPQAPVTNPAAADVSDPNPICCF